MVRHSLLAAIRLQTATNIFTIFRHSVLKTELRNRVGFLSSIF
jgi:hypothetical protein